MANSREFGLHMRIPSWTTGASISINGKRQVTEINPGGFAVVRRQWRSGDRVELDLPMAARLEAIDTQHPETVALMNGPLVLFALTNALQVVTRKQLLAAKRTGAQRWQVDTSRGAMTMLPFTKIGDEGYSTYLKVS